MQYIFYFYVDNLIECCYLKVNKQLKPSVYANAFPPFYAPMSNFNDVMVRQNYLNNIPYFNPPLGSMIPQPSYMNNILSQNRFLPNIIESEGLPKDGLIIKPIKEVSLKAPQGKDKELIIPKTKLQDSKNYNVKLEANLEMTRHSSSVNNNKITHKSSISETDSDLAPKNIGELFKEDYMPVNEFESPLVEFTSKFPDWDLTTIFRFLKSGKTKDAYESEKRTTKEKKRKTIQNKMKALGLSGAN